MDNCILLVLAGMVMSSSSWSVPYYPAARAPLRVVRYAAPPHQHIQPPPAPHHTLPVQPVSEPVQEGNHEPERQRPKRGHDSHEYDGHGSSGVTGPVHTFVKTDKNANYKWGVRHHVGDKFSA